MVRRVLIVFATTMFLLSMSEHNARSQGDQGSLIEQAHSHYAAKRYSKAALAFFKAYEDRGSPELCYNAARSAEKALQGKLAIQYYRQFLQLKGSLAEYRTKARNSLNALEAEEALNQPKPKISTGLQESSKEVIEAKDTNKRPQDTAEEETNLKVRKTSGPTAHLILAPRTYRNLDTYKWVTAAGALTGVALGTGLLLSGMKDEANISAGLFGNGSSLSKPEAESQLQSASTKKTIGTLMLGLGSALATTSIVLFVLDSEQQPANRDQGLSLSPILGEATGFTLSGTF